MCCVIVCMSFVVVMYCILYLKTNKKIIDSKEKIKSHPGSFRPHSPFLSLIVVVKGNIPKNK